MVVLVDLDERPPNPLTEHGFADLKQQLRDTPSSSDKAPESPSVREERPNPNINCFSACLSCYPIVCELATLLDLNSLHDLSRTCRQFRANLLQYRNQLVTRTLRCSNEQQTAGDRLGALIRESHNGWAGNSFRGRLTSGKVGKCARDMVGECRRCGVIVCRNCTTKPPPPIALPGRHRRLCRTCQKAPLSLHLQFPRPTTTPPTSPALIPTTPPPHASVSSLASDTSTASTIAAEPAAFTSAAFQRDPCKCADEVYLCQPCGSQLRSSDGFYMGGWTWRTRYSTYLGGLGTGIGEGSEGVQCGRKEGCLAVHEVEKEVDCDEATIRLLEERGVEVLGEGQGWGEGSSLSLVQGDGPASRADGHPPLSTSPSNSRRWGNGGGYVAQEIEGVGGGSFGVNRSSIRKKVKKRVRIGHIVREYEEERDRGTYLGREREGKVRSWCSWCERVIPSKTEAQELCL